MRDGTFSCAGSGTVMIESLESRQFLSVAPALGAAAGLGSKVAGVHVDRDHASPNVQSASKTKYPPLTNLTTGTWSGSGSFKVKTSPFSSKKFNLKIDLTFSNLTATSVDVNLKISGDLNEAVNTTGKGRFVKTGKKAGTFSKYTFPDQSVITNLKLTNGLIKQISSKTDTLTASMSGKLELSVLTFSKSFPVKLKRAHTTA